MSSALLANALARDGECAASAVRSANLLKTLSTAKVDLVVIAADVDSESGSGFRLASAVCREYPDIFLIILLDQTTHELVVNAFRCGARGVFSREQDMAELLDCVDHVRRGFIWAGRQETSLLLDAFKSIPAPNLVTSPNTPALTARELQVVQCAATGKTNKTIASDLRLSEHTVKNYLFRAFDKLGISSRVELLFYLTVKGHTFNMTNTDSEASGVGIE
jgi:DNA-binding NarL/FixJ family response regulator